MKIKNIFSTFLFFGFVGFNFNIPTIPEINVDERIEEVRERMPESSFGAYTDSSYTNKQTGFSSGQTIYVLAKARIDESASRSLVLWDENKNIIKDIPVSIVESGYVAQFNAPTKQGMYYLHFEVKGEGLSIVFETNINIGGSSGEVVGESTVVSNVTSEVISTEGEVLHNENEQIMPNNRLNSLQIVGWWVSRLKELIINILTKA